VTLVKGLRLAFFACLVFVTWQTLTPDLDDRQSGFDIARWIAVTLFGDDAHADKVAHFIAYLGLGSVGRFAQVSQAPALAAALAAYGGALEIIQGLGGARSADLGDAAMNALGAGAGAAAAALALAQFGKRVRP